MAQHKNALKVEFIITAVLAVVLVFSVIGRLNKPKPKTGALGQAQGQAGASAVSQTQFVKPQEINWGRDPFSAVQIKDTARAVSKEELRLEGIVWDQKNPKAIINGQIYSVGARIGSRVITKITKDCIFVSDGSREYPIKVW